MYLPYSVSRTTLVAIFEIYYKKDVLVKYVKFGTLSIYIRKPNQITTSIAFTKNCIYQNLIPTTFKIYNKLHRTTAITKKEKENYLCKFSKYIDYFVDPYLSHSLCCVCVFQPENMCFARHSLFRLFQHFNIYTQIQRLSCLNNTIIY